MDRTNVFGQPNSTGFDNENLQGDGLGWLLEVVGNSCGSLRVVAASHWLRSAGDSPGASQDCHRSFNH